MFFNIFKRKKEDSFIKGRDEAIRRIDDLLLTISGRTVSEDIASDIGNRVYSVYIYLNKFYKLNKDKLNLSKIDDNKSLKIISRILKDSVCVTEAANTGFRVTRETLPIIREELLNISNEDLFTEEDFYKDKKRVVVELHNIISRLIDNSSLEVERNSIINILEDTSILIENNYKELKKKSRNPLDLIKNINECEKYLLTHEFSDKERLSTVLICLNNIKTYLK